MVVPLVLHCDTVWACSKQRPGAMKKWCCQGAGSCLRWSCCEYSEWTNQYSVQQGSAKISLQLVLCSLSLLLQYFFLQWKNKNKNKQIIVQTPECYQGWATMERKGSRELGEDPPSGLPAKFPRPTKIAEWEYNHLNSIATELGEKESAQIQIGTSDMWSERCNLIRETKSSVEVSGLRPLCSWASW